MLKSENDDVALQNRILEFLAFYNFVNFRGQASFNIQKPKIYYRVNPFKILIYFPKETCKLNKSLAFRVVISATFSAFICFILAIFSAT